MLALSNGIIFEGRALIKTLCEPCFVDYQSTVIGILRNKGSRKNSFGRKEIILSAIVHSCMCNKSLLFSVCFVSFRIGEYRKPVEGYFESANACTTLQCVHEWFFVK